MILSEPLAFMQLLDKELVKIKELIESGNMSEQERKNTEREIKLMT